MTKEEEQMLDELMNEMDLYVRLTNLEEKLCQLEERLNSKDRECLSEL